MDIFFHDPDDIPLPPDKVHIRSLSAEPHRDGHKIKVTLEISPFQKRPSGEISIVDAENRIVASASIIETITKTMEMTLHLRVPNPLGLFTVRADLFYTEDLEDENGDQSSYTLPERIPVDQAQTSFQLDAP